MNDHILKFDDKEIQPKLTWAVENGDNWSVLVEGWPSVSSEGLKWKWNVHLYVNQIHDMFGRSADFFKALPFHGGPSFDQVLTYGHHEYKYDWQRDFKVRKVGSDYGHHGDCLEEDSPINGVPNKVYCDAAELVRYMREWD